MTARRSMLIQIPSSVLFSAFLLLLLAPSWSLLLKVDLARHLFPLSREFLFKCYSLLIAWGFLVPTPLECLVQFVPYGFGEFLVLIPFCGVNLFAPMFRRLDLFARLPRWHGFVMFLVRGLSFRVPCFYSSNRYSFISVVPVFDLRTI